MLLTHCWEGRGGNEKKARKGEDQEKEKTRRRKGPGQREQQEKEDLWYILLGWQGSYGKKKTRRRNKDLVVQYRVYSTLLYTCNVLYTLYCTILYICTVLQTFDCTILYTVLYCTPCTVKYCTPVQYCTPCTVQYCTPVLYTCTVLQTMFTRHTTPQWATIALAPVGLQVTLDLFKLQQDSQTHTDQSGFLVCQNRE